MSPTQEEALRERAAMGDLTLLEVAYEAHKALNIASRELIAGNTQEAARYARLASDLIRAKGAK